MGMFDYVNVQMDCPFCDEPLVEFQTKDYFNTLSCVEPEEVANFYTKCDNCGEWVEFVRKRPERKCREIPFSREEIEAMGFKLCPLPKD